MTVLIDQLRNQVREATTALTKVRCQLKEIDDRLSANCGSITMYQNKVAELETCIKQKNSRIAHLERCIQKMKDVYNELGKTFV